jgi:1A family penicillin-binding protein
MPLPATIYPDEHLAQNKLKKTLGTIQSVLIFIGRPFYFILALSIIFVLFILFPLANFIKKLLLKRFFHPSGKPAVRYQPKGRYHFPHPRLKLRLRLIPALPARSAARRAGRLFLLLLLPLLLLFVFWRVFLTDLPAPSELTTRQQDVSTKIYDRNGVLLYKIYKSQNRSPVTLNQVPVYIRQATLAAEDAEFYNHIGFSIRGMTRAFFQNLKTGQLSGGSTITQQLVKNVLLTSDKTLTRKIRELVLAVEVEATFNKDQILEMYLNEVSYGGTAYGIQEAARLYFGKDVKDLTLAEAALLAGLPKSPTKYSPFGTNPDLAIARQKDVLNLMVINHFITEDEAEKAEAEKLNFAPNKIDIKAPHFVIFVRELLEDKYGTEMVERGGLEVTTTLDLNTQKMAEEAVSSEIDKLKGYHVGNGAALVVDPQTGEILAMVGSKNYFDTEGGGNVNVVTALRQPGSSIKVINYSYALAHGYTPATTLDDSPVTFSTPGSLPYSPKNYDGRYRGKLPLRNAFAESRNVPAVKVLASYGVNKMIEQGKAMGITTWDDSSQYGLSLTLGGGDVKLIDLANVYATVSNYGKKPTLNPILKITNYKGGVLEENQCANLAIQSSNHSAISSCSQPSILDPGVAYQIIDILKDATARIPAFGRNSSLTIANHPEVAVKTGTSNDMRDNLTVGFNQNYLVAVWVGNNDNSPMARIASGITGAAPIWNKIMTNLLEKPPQEWPQGLPWGGKMENYWPVPENLTKISICPYTATLPCEGCPVKSEWFIKGTEPTKYCSPEWFTPTPSPSAQPQPQIL